VVPTIFVAVFSYLLFSFGVQAWFSERVRTAISESLAVAEAYLHEHQQAIRADVLSMASDLNRDAGILSMNPDRLGRIVQALPLGVEGIIDAPLPRPIATPVYSRVGDVPAAMIVAVALLLLVHGRRQPGAGKSDGYPLTQ